MFGEASYEITDALTLTAGGRYYDFDETRTITSGGLFEFKVDPKRAIALDLLYYFRPGFHPNDYDDSAMIAPIAAAVTPSTKATIAARPDARRGMFPPWRRFALIERLLDGRKRVLIINMVAAQVMRNMLQRHIEFGTPEIQDNTPTPFA